MGLHEDCYPLTKEAYLKFQAEIDAWARGEQIQYRIGNGEWNDIKEGEDPNWIISVEYRVKPDENHDHVKDLLYSTLRLNTDHIPNAGKTISLQEMFLVLKFIERNLRVRLNRPYEFRNVQMVFKPKDN